VPVALLVRVVVRVDADVLDDAILDLAAARRVLEWAQPLEQARRVRSPLLREIWGYSSDVMSRTVDMHIMELRRKLEAGPANPRHFHTVRKTGYRFMRG
jgi:DNA-binding response OmpR family regulator